MIVIETATKTNEPYTVVISETQTDILGVDGKCFEMCRMTLNF